MPSSTTSVSTTDLQLGWVTKPVTSRNPIGFQEKAQNKRTSSRGMKPWKIKDPESHLLTLAPTGAGKGRNAIIPACLTWPGSMVVIDPKGEATQVTARRRRELGNRVLVLDPFGVTKMKSDSLNPLDILPYTDMSVEEFSLQVPSYLHPDHDKSFSKDPFWDVTSDDLIVGVAGYVLGVAPPEERHLPKLRELFKCDDVVYKLATILDTHKDKLPKQSYQNMASFVSTEDRCRSSILATAQQHFTILGDPRVVDAVTTTSFDLKAFQDGEPMTIYIVLPPTRLVTHRILLRTWISALLNLVKHREARPEIPTLFMIDEAAQLGRMNSLLESITLLRSYGIRTWTFWQSRRQLTQIYGDDGGIIMDNCGVIQTFGLTNHEMADSMVTLMGGRYGSKDILGLGKDEQLILTPGGEVHRLRRMDYLKDRCYEGLYDDNPMYRNHRPKKL